MNSEISHAYYLQHPILQPGLQENWNGNIWRELRDGVHNGDGQISKK